MLEDTSAPHRNVLARLCFRWVLVILALVVALGGPVQAGASDNDDLASSMHEVGQRFDDIGNIVAGYTTGTGLFTLMFKVADLLTGNDSPTDPVLGRIEADLVQLYDTILDYANEDLLTKVDGEKTTARDAMADVMAWVRRGRPSGDPTVANDEWFSRNALGQLRDNDGLHQRLFHQGADAAAFFWPGEPTTYYGHLSYLTPNRYVSFDDSGTPHMIRDYRVYLPQLTDATLARITVLKTIGEVDAKDMDDLAVALGALADDIAAGIDCLEHTDPQTGSVYTFTCTHQLWIDVYPVTGHPGETNLASHFWTLDDVIASEADVWRIPVDRQLVRAQIEDDIGLTGLRDLIGHVRAVEFCAAHPAICDTSVNETTVLPPDWPPADSGGSAGAGGDGIQHPPGWHPHPILFE